MTYNHTTKMHKVALCYLAEVSCQWNTVNKVRGCVENYSIDQATFASPYQPRWSYKSLLILTPGQNSGYICLPTFDNQFEHMELWLKYWFFSAYFINP